MNVTPQPVRASRRRTPGAPRAARPRRAMQAPTTGVLPFRLPCRPPKLDLTFTIDKTSSMHQYLEVMKKHSWRIAERLDCEGIDARFGLVVYQDYKQEDDDGLNVSKRWPFTRIFDEFHSQLKSIQAEGGGDGCEAVEAGLGATLEMDWRADATKVCVLIGDAPPHGLGECDDNFQDGAGIDPFVVVDEMAKEGITIFAVGCDELDAAFEFGSDFWVAIAEKTGGRSVALPVAAPLCDVILGSALQEVEETELMEAMSECIRNLRIERPGLNDQSEVEVAYQSMHASAIQVRRLEAQELPATEESARLVEAQTLGEAREALGVDEKSPPRDTLSRVPWVPRSPEEREMAVNEALSEPAPDAEAPAPMAAGTPRDPGQLGVVKVSLKEEPVSIDVFRRIYEKGRARGAFAMDP